jgi:hypothetical protein
VVRGGGGPASPFMHSLNEDEIIIIDFISEINNRRTFITRTQESTRMSIKQCIKRQQANV